MNIPNAGRFVYTHTPALSGRPYPIAPRIVRRWREQADGYSDGYEDGKGQQ